MYFEKMVKVENELLQDPLVTTSLEKKQNKDSFATYEYEDNIRVPRCTEVIRNTSGMNDGLLYWAANMGKAYGPFKKKTLNIGTSVHQMIEYFLKNGSDMDITGMERDSDQIVIAYNNFKSWYYHLLNTGIPVEVLGLEIPLISPFFGGTADAILRINGNVFVVDWKTSQKVNLDYFLQASAYYWIINSGYCNLVKKADGIGILRIDKTKEGYDEYFLNERFNSHAQILHDCMAGFNACLNWYYHKIKLEGMNIGYNAMTVPEIKDILDQSTERIRENYGW